MSHYSGLIFVVLIGVLGIGRFVTCSIEKANNTRKFRLAYLLVFPYLMDCLQGEIKTRASANKPLLTRTEIFGWVIFLIIVAIALILGDDGVAMLFGLIFG